MISSLLIKNFTAHEREELINDLGLNIRDIKSEEDGYILAVLTKHEYELLQDINNYYDRIKQQEFIKSLNGNKS